jgi:proline iminopeptidase
MDRRQLLLAGALGGLAAGVADQPSSAAPSDTTPADGLNPPGIRVAGIRMLPVVGGKYKVWTKKVGSGDVKVLLLHGGPGFSHDYLEAMESFLPQAGVEFYYYDQLGSNLSDQPDDHSLWTLPRFVEEVEEVRQGLGLDQFVLYGHSWGGLLGIEYALTYQQHLRGLVISNMTAGIQSYLKRTEALKGLLTPPSRKRLAELEAREDYDNPDYEKIMMEELYPKMICRVSPWPEPVTRAFRYAWKPWE